MHRATRSVVRASASRLAQLTGPAASSAAAAVAALPVRPTAAFARCFHNAAATAATAAAASRPSAAASAASTPLPSDASSQLPAPLLSPSQLLHLRCHGWLVLDPPASSPFADAAYRARLRESVLRLSSAGHLTLNHTHIVQTLAQRRQQPSSSADAPAMERSFVPKQSVWEADFAARPGLIAAGHADSLPEPDRALWADLVADCSLRSGLNSALALSSAAYGSAPCTLDRQTIKAHVIEGGGGCFPIHCDTAPRVDARRITAILYLNPDWSAEQGGALRLYPFPHASVDVAPIDGRLVLFDSRRMHHRVLPTGRAEATEGSGLTPTEGSNRVGPTEPSNRRVCISWWMWQQEEQWKRDQSAAFSASASASATGEPSPFVAQQRSSLRALLPSASPSALRALCHLLSPSYLPHLTKLALASEWFSSLEQSHPTQSAITQSMLVRHLDECDMIDAAMGPLLRQITETTEAPAGGERRSAEEDWRSLFPLPTPPAPQLSADTPLSSEQHPPRLVEWLD